MMPYSIEKHGDEWCVVKDADGDVLGCHDTEDGAEAQLRAVYANEHKDLIHAFMDVVNKEVSRLSQDEAGFKDVSEDAKSCASCRWFDGKAGGMCLLVQNYPADVTAKSVCARHEEVEPVFESAGAPEPDDAPVKEHVADAASAAIEESPSILKQVWTFVKSIFPANSADDADAAEANGIKVHGNTFLIVWSNNFEDRDGEIFTQKAIDDYISRVDGGVVPPPDVWLWHAGKDTRVGAASWVARHGHFLLAVGDFDATANGQRAKAYFLKHARRIGVSHGFTYPREQFDGRHYHAFNTFEISLLPRGKEANRFTTLERIKEMALKPEQKKFVEDVFGAEALTDLDAAGKAIEDAGAAYKDYLAPQDAETADAAEDADLKALVADLIRDNAQLAQLVVAGGKAQLAQKDAFDARAADLNSKLDTALTDLAALKEQLDGRPRSASEAKETELTAERLAAIEKQAEAQNLVRHPFWGTMVPADNLNGA